MATGGIAAVYLTTHNWGKAAKFFQSLGFELEFETGHGSGQLRGGTGPSVFIAEVPEHEPTELRLVAQVPSDGYQPDGPVEVVEPFADTHYGTREMTVRDPDGRTWVLQAPGGN